jgi:hypothetical protein
MPGFRNRFLPFIPCFIAEAAIYFGLFALGAEEQLIILVETVWLLCTVYICLRIGELLDRR